MNKANARRRNARWARYFNRYAYLVHVYVGRSAARREVWAAFRRDMPFRYIRKQAKR